MSKTDKPSNELVVKMLPEDPAFADEYLAASLKEINEPGGQEALLAALRQIAEAQGITSIAKQVGISCEDLNNSLSPNSDPTLEIFLAIVNAAGLKLTTSNAARSMNL